MLDVQTLLGFAVPLSSREENRLMRIGKNFTWQRLVLLKSRECPHCTLCKDSRGPEDDPGVVLCAVALLYSKYAHADVQDAASQH